MTRTALRILPLSAGLLVLASLGAPPAPLQGQLRPAAPLQEAYFAWDEGRYVEAMEGYLGVLRGPAGEAHRREAALLTGELHPVRELDDDGRFLGVSPDGRWVSWARNLGDAAPSAPGGTDPDGWQTRIEPAEGAGRLVLPTRLVALSGQGTVAWVESDGILRVRALEAGSGTPRTPDTGAGATEAPLGTLRVQALAFRPDAPELILAAAPSATDDPVHLFRATAPDWTPEPLPVNTAQGTGFPVLTNPVPAAGGRVILATVPPRSPFSASAQDATPTGGPGFALVDTGTGRVLLIQGTAPSLARDGSRVSWYTPPGGIPGGAGFGGGGGGGGGAQAAQAAGLPGRILTLDLTQGVPASEASARVVVESTLRLGDPATSPDGSRVAFKAMPHTDWEIFLVGADAPEPLDPGTAANPPQGLARVTREIQHDQFPAWIDDRHLLALKGEARHRRSYLHDLETGEAYRLFHNNTLRTIAPEYEWVVSPDGRSLLVSAERDGNTISPERGVFRIDLAAEVSLADLTRRLEANLAHEIDLLAEGEARFAPIHDEVARVSGAVQVGRVHHYADHLYRMGSKFIGEPGNLEATEYLAETLRSWGYEVELEWFEPRGIRAANVIARLPGTANPELIYTISSHFDSVLPAPGADDNSSGTTALLEAARVLSDQPRRATIEFAFLTAEEAGLLGAREYVRLAVENGKRIVGVLNNDMIGWTRSHRLDNTIRYSNPGIMRIQHAASHFYSDLITYDALYYRGTDGAVFYEAYGDIVGGIGSYPVLGNPNYHQRTDQVETINHRLVAEVSRTTVASIMYLADAPSRLEAVRISGRTPSAIEVSWSAAPEAGVEGYRIRVLGTEGGTRDLGVVPGTSHALTGVRSGDRVQVRAVGAGGLEGWDWAEVVIP